MSDHAAAIRGLPRWHPNPYIRSAIETIRRDGWQVTAVDTVCACSSVDCSRPDCAFAYTAGLTLHGIPELAVYGLPSNTSRALLDELAGLLHQHDWRTLVHSHTEVTSRTMAAPVRLIEAIDTDDMLMANLLFADSPALQVVWPDDNGHYPWQDEYTLLPLHQPLKGIEDPTTGYRRTLRVITTERGPDRALPRTARRMKGH